MTSPFPYTHVSTRLATADDVHLEAWDYTKLTACNTCPTWGGIRYREHKHMPGGGRAMALEAGKACHEAYAALRVWQLYHVQGEEIAAFQRGEQVFGKQRFKELCDTLSSTNTAEHNATVFALKAFETSGFYDDPFDNRRTYGNIELSLIHYINRWDMERYPVWISADGARVGIEIPVNFVIEYKDADDNVLLALRYSGRMDGMHTDGPGGELVVHENKTAGRLDNAWRESFTTSHQPTGYMFGGQLFSGQPVTQCQIIGMQIPLPRMHSDGVVYEPVFRESHHFAKWLQWVFFTVSMMKQFDSNLLDLPMYTHSCNRYFRPCSMIPYCYGDEDEKRHTLEQMSIEEWSPLHEDGGLD